MKIAIVVQGRFHAFDFARALLRRGHEVTVFTNYPQWAARRFDIPGARIRSFVAHGIAARASECLRFTLPEERLWLHKLFGAWAARQLRRENWDVVHAFSGVAEEVLADRSIRARTKNMLRGSAHIRHQHQLLTEEEERTFCRLPKPSQDIMAREEREYGLADSIFVLSSFAARSFVDFGVDPAKVTMMPLGVDTSRFTPSRSVVDARVKRILGDEPLRILMVGSLSCQKGVMDLCRIVQSVRSTEAHFRFVGDVPPEGKRFVHAMGNRLELIPRQAQFNLPAMYEWGDLFVFPTIQDGYAVVLAQAQASGLPILTTTNCSGPDIVVEGESGWVLPIRQPEAFVNRLLWCHANRLRLATMAESLGGSYTGRDWNDVAADFETAVQSHAGRIV